MKFKSHSVYAYSYNVMQPDEQPVNKTEYLNQYGICISLLLGKGPVITYLLGGVGGPQN